MQFSLSKVATTFAVTLLLLCGTSAHAQNLSGVWKLQIMKSGQVQQEYSVQFSQTAPNEYRGRYLVPQGNTSVFEAEVYPGRQGSPLVLIRQLDGQYYGVICGFFQDGKILATHRDNDGLNKQMRFVR